MDKELEELIISDLCRYGVKSQKELSLFARHEMYGFRYSRILRKTKYYKEHNKKIKYIINRIKLVYYSEKFGFLIPYNTIVGPGLYLGHLGSIVVNYEAKIGKNVNLAQGVTIGLANGGKKKGVPTIGDSVWIGANATIVGGITIGDDVMIAPNTFVNFDVPSHSIVVSGKANIVERNQATVNYVENKWSRNMRKVAIVTPALVTGGAETMAVRLAVNINRKDYCVKVFCLSKKAHTPLEKQLEDSNIDVEYLGKKGKGSITTIIKTWKSLSKFRPDVVHSHISGTIYALPWILCHKTKLIHTVHTRPDKEFSDKFRTVLGWLAKKNKIVIVAVSKENQKIAEDYYKIGNKVVYVNNPVEISKYYKIDKTNDEIVFINVSRQDANKNQILVIRAFAEVNREFPNTRLVLVGDGNQHVTLIEETEKLGLIDAINLVGESSEVEKYLANADIYVSASHREGLPLSMIEAMASKLPVISSNVGGVPDLINGNGLLFEDDDINALIKNMIILVKDSEMRKEMGEKSYKIVEDFDVSKCAEKYQHLYDIHSGVGRH